MLHAILYLLLIVCLVGGLFIVIVNLPGLWVMALAATIYAVLTKLSLITTNVLLVLLAMALIAEIIDFVAAGAAAKRAGAGRRGMIGAIIGGLVGAVLFTVPLAIIGTLIGVCIGTFLGALIGELSGGKQVGQSIHVGVNATAGRLFGTLCKLATGVVMLLITIWCAWPWPRHVPASLASPTIVLPTTTRGS